MARGRARKRAASCPHQAITSGAQPRRARSSISPGVRCGCRFRKLCPPTRGQQGIEHDRRMIAIAFLFVGVLCDCFKSRRRLEAEILVLRHQLNVLQQHAPRRLPLRWADRALFIWLYRRCPRILDAVPSSGPRLLCVGIAWASPRIGDGIPSTRGPATDRQRGARPDPKNEY
jgi:hypothetical protein